jgi:hypothetical protein
MLTLDALTEMTIGLGLPESLKAFARRPELQRRIRSVTACYLDLGDVAVRTTAPGQLVHFLSDQQWCLHWLVYADGSGCESVLVTDVPIGFDIAEAWGEPVPEVVPLDGSFRLEVCADSFGEFLYRFWIENELWWALRRGGKLPPHLAAYAGQLSERNES